MKRLLWGILSVILLLCSGCTAAGGDEPCSPSPESVVVTATPTMPTVLLTAPPAEEETADTEALPLPPLSGLVIGVDAGHQKHANYEQEPLGPNSSVQKAKVSPGTRGTLTKTPEYEVNLAVARLLQTLLEEAGATVIMTRTENDVNISNRERAELFNRYEVDLAVRLHCNGADDPEIHGAFLLIPDKQCTRWYEENRRAAECILHSYLERTKLEQRLDQGISVRDDQTGFHWCERPIVCIEMGHLTHAEEELLLVDALFQKKMAQGIFEGIQTYFSDREP